ncbi:hypothetical protein Ssi03_71010 [Sphaerisporangium siamense]|uniref:DUF397 domain-containing protein n=1 Tax=Sphaerisporangium siamense TaxID=795645 RepID=A0A7W7D1Y4_9ACTN|nr:DUF397 domain-containing protein [Sphaerisporangium siamense]MBB4698773.1 hypothetical protein [Sphaerisporangium siamense]GII89111.1 hypothetical protein Ssi03_71010 [Sphaerisporangium siamense]
MNDREMDHYTCDLASLGWRKPAASAAENDCVEVANLSGGAKAVRDSKNPDGGVLCFTASEWDVFHQGILLGQL